MRGERPPEDENQPMEPKDVRIFATAADFRTWLDKHHDTATELWVGYYKKGVPKTSMTYPESVDEALCFGWIDGQARRIDDEVTSIRFSPRRPTSSWSAINIAKVGQLKASGRMRPAGLRAFEERDRRKDAPSPSDRPAQELPAEMLERLKADEAAWTDWQARAPSFRRGATAWVLSAKRAETRERRFGELLAACATGGLPAPFQVTREQRESAATKETNR
jgi:uncharacterized protein YdeI (YjbR/CyaY-like superfamily)